MAIEHISAAAQFASAADVTRVPAPKLSTAEADGANARVARAVSQPSEEQVRRVADESKTAPREIPVRHPRIRLDPETKRLVTQLVDENQEVVRQIPPEQLVEFAARFRKLQGLLFDKRV